MKPEQFCYWMQGFAELSGDTPPTPEQWKSIREHLALVFEKVTPPVEPTKKEVDRRVSDAIREIGESQRRRAEEEARRLPRPIFWPPSDVPYRKPDFIC